MDITKYFSTRTFSPTEVSRNGGAWFDPSDLSTLYQDAAGTTPVTAVEQPVGLMLDKSRGMMLGPELVSNGTFDSDINGWTQGNSITTTWVNGTASMARSGVVDGSLAFRQSVPVTQGKIYKITFTASGNSVARQISGVTPVTGPAAAGIGTFSFILTATTTSILLNFWPTTDGTTTTLDNISIKELYGYHATQSITASRPTLSARYNLLTKTEDFSNDVWVKSETTISSNKAVPSTLSAPHYVYQPTALIIPQASVVSFNVDAKSDGYSYVRLQIESSTGLVYAACRYDLSSGAIVPTDKDIALNGATNVTSRTTQKSDGVFNCRIECVIPAATQVRANCRIVSTSSDFSFAGDGVSGVILTKAEIRPSSTSGPYQRVNTSTDYDTDERYFPKYLRFDGIDDYLNLPYMNLYSGSAASIICARDCVSQATDTYIISERSTTSTSPQYLPSRQLANSGNMDAYIANDAAAVVLDTVGSPFSGVANSVIRSIVDSGNNLKLFKNGILAANDNYTRSGTLTLNNTTIGASVSTTTSNYASMKLYGLIVTKSALTDSQRIACERYLGRKSGVQL